MFIPLKIVLIGIDPYPYIHLSKPIKTDAWIGLFRYLCQGGKVGTYVAVRWLPYVSPALRWACEVFFFQEENFPYVHGFPEFLLPNLCIRIWNAKLGSIEQGVKDILRTLHQRQFPHTCVQFSVVGDSVESIWRFPIHGGTPKSIKIMGPMGAQKLVTHALDIVPDQVSDQVMGFIHQPEACQSWPTSRSQALQEMCWGYTLADSLVYIVNSVTYLLYICIIHTYIYIYIYTILYINYNYIYTLQYTKFPSSSGWAILTWPGREFSAKRHNFIAVHISTWPWRHGGGSIQWPCPCRCPTNDMNQLQLLIDHRSQYLS